MGVRSKYVSSSSSSSGIGFSGLLTIVFITLKLTHYIDWSWKWVLSPLWIPLAIVCFALVCVGTVVVILKVADAVFKDYKRKKKQNNK